MVLAPTEGSVSPFMLLDLEDAVLGHSPWGFHPKRHQRRSVTFRDFCIRAELSGVVSAL